MFKPFSLNIKGSLREFVSPAVMGIVNVTPDSFYDRSRSMDELAIAGRVRAAIADGADMLDLGAYSSRSGADVVPVEEEVARLRRGLKVIRDISPEIIVSVDTFRAEVARVAVSEFGADIINDISGGTLDDKMFETVAFLGVPYILMHMRGTPATMQQMCEYEDVTADVIRDLSVKLRSLRLLGVADVIVDPGFGFAKTTEQNYEMMKNLECFDILEAPLLVGISRKSMITKPLEITADEALVGTAVLDTIALSKGASILRVHDVKSAVQTRALYELSTN